jgi:hypothetical protein
MKFWAVMKTVEVAEILNLLSQDIYFVFAWSLVNILKAN